MVTYAPKPAHFGESVLQFIARELEIDEEDLTLIPGKIFVSEELLAEKDGKSYRYVTLSCHDRHGENCVLKRTWYEGQCYHADAFIPFKGKTVVAGVTGVDTKKVRDAPARYNRAKHIYTYDVKELFLLSLHAPRPGQPEVTSPVPVPGEAPVMETPAALPQWDDPLPDEIIPEPEALTPQPTKTRTIMTPAQLAKEQQSHWEMLAGKMPRQDERMVFLLLHAIPLDFQQWQEGHFKDFNQRFERWYYAITPEHPIGHDNWDQPILPAQKQQINELIDRFPPTQGGRREGKLLIVKHRNQLGFTLLEQMNAGMIACMLEQVLADPGLPAKVR
jgi:hypothetical protein